MHGFTLIELVVTVFVAALLLSLAAPSLRTVVQNTRITAQANDLVADLNYARSEAIKRRNNVVVCQSTNGTTCTGGDWQDGRLIMTGATVLRFRGAEGSNDGTLVLSGQDPVFLPSGITQGVSTFKVCDDRGAGYGKTVTLNNTGQAVVSPTAPASCT